MEISYNVLKSNLDRYSLDGLEDYFRNLDDDELLVILHDINYNLNLINQFPNANKKIINFRNFFKKLLLDRNIKNDLFNNIEIIEELYSSVLKDKSKLKLKDIDLIQSLLKFSKEKQEIIASELENLMVKDAVLNDLNLNYSNYDREIESLCKLINYNLQSISYTSPNLINNNNEIVLPSIVLNEEQSFMDDLQIFEHLKNTGMWDIVQNLDYNFRFFSSPSQSILDEEKEIYSFDMNYYRYALISIQRINLINSSIIYEQFSKLGKSFNKISNHDKEIMLLRDIFYRFYFIDILEDNTQYKGLTIREWILGFLSLRELSDKYGFRGVSIETIKKCFLKNGINFDRKADSLINYLTYKKERRSDLYDNPLIRIDDGTLLIFPLTIKNSNIEKILSSIFSKFDLHILDKGKRFENEVFNDLKKLEEYLPIKVSDTKFSVKTDKKEQYQFDAIMEWGDYVFIIECKNRSIPTTDYISLNQFDEKLIEYIKQVDRLEYGLFKNPKKHGINLVNKKILKIVLNSLPFSLDYPINNIYFTDYSCFSRFFSSKEICLERMSEQNQVEVEKVVQTLWSGNEPTPEDFIKYLTAPPQVTYIKSKIKSYMSTHKIGDYLIKVERSYF